MQVDVITRHAIRNYGSVLQTIATDEILRRANVDDVRIIDYRQPGYDDSGWSVANRGSARRYPWLGRVAYAGLRDAGMRKIGRVFEQALRSNVKLTQNTYRSNSELIAADEFDPEVLYCAGSDQVWNVEYNVDNAPYYLDFAPRGARKFSLASSIGAASLPAAEESRLVRALRTFVGVSVREADAADYLSGLGVDAEQHVDPTLGVNPSFWRRFAEGAPVSRSPYILVYQLNGAPEFNPILDAVAKELDLPIKRVEYWRGPRSLRYPSVVLPDIPGFVRLFRDASFVVTDSFHGTVFSTTFAKPYVAVPPPKYSGRIRSLLELTGESHRIAQTVGTSVEIARDGSALSDSESLLAAERDKLSRYLESITSSKAKR